MDPIGVVGLGIMGIAYARNLINSEFQVVGMDVEETRRQALSDLDGQAVSEIRDLTSMADVVLTALPTVAALDDVVSQIVEAGTTGLVVVEMSTFPLDAKESARRDLRQVGIEMIDAPVSGTGLQAEAADIVVYASGDPALIERLRPVFRAVAKETFDLGEFGNGSKMKFVANLLVSINNLATAEAFVLGMKAGLEPQQILEVISAGVGTSRIFEIRGPMVVNGDYPAAAKLEMFIKDIGVIGDFGRELGAPTPLLDASLPWYEHATREGLGELDAAALATLLESIADLRR